MLLLWQLVVVAVGGLPDRIGLDRRRHQLEGPVADGILSVRLRGAADRHQRAHEVRMQDAPDIGLRSAHGHAGDQRCVRDLQLVAQHAVIRLHHVEIAVLRKLDAEPVGRFARTPGAERINHDDVVAVGVDRASRSDDRYAAGQCGALDPLFEHVGGIARIIGVNDNRIGDLARSVAPRRTDRDIGGAQLAAAERFKCHSALAAILPLRWVGQVVFAAEPEVRDLVILLEAVMLHLRRAARVRRISPGDADANDEQQKTDNEPLHGSLPDRALRKASGPGAAAALIYLKGIEGRVAPTLPSSMTQTRSTCHSSPTVPIESAMSWTVLKTDRLMCSSMDSRNMPNCGAAIATN